MSFSSNQLCSARKITLLAGAVLLLSTAILPAKVFIKWQGNSDIPGTLARFGGKTAYEADVSINGSRGHISVLGFSDPRDTTSADIQRILKLPQTRHPGATPTTTIWNLKGANSVTRLILLRIPAKQKLLAIIIRQSSAEYKKSRNCILQPYSAIPAYPGSTPKFIVQNHDTDMTVATSSAAAPPEAIRQFYFHQLKTSGWQTYLSSPRGPVADMTIYQRGSEICCIFAAPAKNRQLSNITIVHKKLTAKPNS